MLPMNADRLAGMIGPHIDEYMTSGLNYVGQVAALFRQQGWDQALTRDYSRHTRERLGKLLDKKRLPA
jgi:hypothetical protein